MKFNSVMTIINVRPTTINTQSTTFCPVERFGTSFQCRNEGSAKHPNVTAKLPSTMKDATPSHTKDIERDDVLELGVEGAHQHHEHQHTNAHRPLLRRLHEGLVLVGLYTSRPRVSTTVVEDVLDAQHGRVRDDGVGEDGVERQQTGGDDVEHAAVVDVVDEDVLDATCASPPHPHVST